MKDAATGLHQRLPTREKPEFTECSAVSRPQGSLRRHRGLQVPRPGLGVPTCPLWPREAQPPWAGDSWGRPAAGCSHLATKPAQLLQLSAVHFPESLKSKRRKGEEILKEEWDPRRLEPQLGTRVSTGNDTIKMQKLTFALLCINNSIVVEIKGVKTDGL